MKDPDHDLITWFLLCSVGTLSSFCHDQDVSFDSRDITNG